MEIITVGIFKGKYYLSSDRRKHRMHALVLILSPKGTTFGALFLHVFSTRWSRYLDTTAERDVYEVMI